MFTVDCEANLGGRRTSNEELAAFARKHNDTMIAFAGIDPHKDGMGVGDAPRLVEDSVALDFKFHPTHAGFFASTGWPTRPMN
ncbi:hypothetical protein PT2222_390035 [Paraburkholderia tropica]